VPPDRFYRSLRAVKVLLAALCSTLTVLAPQRGGRYRFALEEAVALLIDHAVPRERLVSRYEGIPALIVRSLQELPSDQADLLG
jgi:hypothetical protein